MKKLSAGMMKALDRRLTVIISNSEVGDGTASAKRLREARRFDIVAFRVPDHKSLIYRRFLPQAALLNAVKQATDKGANVISIRLVKRPK